MSGSESHGQGQIVVDFDSPRFLAWKANLDAWRLVPHEEQSARMGAMAPDRAPSTEAGKVRVGIWCPCLLRGGAETWQLTLARSVDQSRISWQGCCAVGGTGMAHDDLMGRMAEYMPVSAGIEEAGRLAGRCDVLLTWAGLDPGPAVEKLARKPLVVSVVHNPKVAYPGFGPIPPESAGRFVAVSELALEAVPPDRRWDARVIPNAVDASHLEVARDREEMRRLWGVPDGCKVAGYLGRLSWEKDPLAMARLAAGLPDDWRVVVVGEGSESTGMAGVDRLILAGGNPKAGDVLNAFDVLVVPSRYESFGLTLAEGLWMGVPVVSTPVGVASVDPWLTYTIPIEADGNTLADAVLAAQRDGAMPGSREFARGRWGVETFGRDWTDYLCEVGEVARVRMVGGCGDRGGVLPLSMQDDCGCKGKELSECRAGKGNVPGRVTLRDCMDCVGVMA